MSNEKNNGGPAFPRPFSKDETYADERIEAQDGMTLRDYFAAKAMQGLNSSNGPTWFADSDVPEMARRAYLMADAMIKAREQ